MAESSSRSANTPYDPTSEHRGETTLNTRKNRKCRTRRSAPIVSIVYGFILERARATTGTATQVAAQALTPLVSPQPDRIDWALGGRARAVGDGNTH